MHSQSIWSHFGLAFGQQNFKVDICSMYLFLLLIFHMVIQFIYPHAIHIQLIANIFALDQGLAKNGLSVRTIFTILNDWENQK